MWGFKKYSFHHKIKESYHTVWSESQQMPHLCQQQLEQLSTQQRRSHLDASPPIELNPRQACTRRRALPWPHVHSRVSRGAVKVRDHVREPAPGSVERISGCRRLLAELGTFIVGAGAAAGELGVQAANLAGARFAACTPNSPAAAPVHTIKVPSSASSLRHPGMRSTDPPAKGTQPLAHSLQKTCREWASGIASTGLNGCHRLLPG